MGDEDDDMNNAPRQTRPREGGGGGGSEAVVSKCHTVVGGCTCSAGWTVFSSILCPTVYYHV